MENKNSYCKEAHDEERTQYWKTASLEAVVHACKVAIHNGASKEDMISAVIASLDTV